MPAYSTTEGLSWGGGVGLRRQKGSIGHGLRTGRGMASRIIAEVNSRHWLTCHRNNVITRIKSIEEEVWTGYIVVT
jgi:hypothetical protein